MKLVLLEEAQQQFEEEDAWWRENRDAKELFVEEFSAVLGRIARCLSWGSVTEERAAS